MWAKNLAIASLSVSIAAAELAQEAAVTIVNQIKRADYEGDRTALKRLAADLAPFLGNQKLTARIRYWRGFALWRRAINGFNDKTDPKELQVDLQLAVDEFVEVTATDAGFADARIGALSSEGLLAFSVGRQDPARVQELIGKGRQFRKDAETAEPDNPRLQWVLGPMLWNTPPERGGGQAKAIEAYRKGLDSIRKQQKTPAADPLAPSWGEPELLMSLAWSSLNQSAPDVNAAEQYATWALDLVSNWHYVRDILLVQIQEAKRKQN